MCSINWMMVLAGHTKLLRIKIFVAPTWKMVLAEYEMFSRIFCNIVTSLNKIFVATTWKMVLAEKGIFLRCIDICCTYTNDGFGRVGNIVKIFFVRLSPYWIRIFLHQLNNGPGRVWKGNEMTRSSRYFCHLPQSPLTAIIWDLSKIWEKYL